MARQLKVRINDVSPLFFRTQIKSALKQRVYDQNCGEMSPKKTAQKRTSKDTETAANGQNGVAAKKIKQGIRT